MTMGIGVGLEMGADGLRTILGVGQEIAPGIASVWVNALWQGVLVAGCLAVLLKFAPRTSGALRFAAWISVFSALVCLPFLPLLLRFASAPTSAGSANGATASGPWLELDIRWSLAIAALWFIASLLRVVDLALHSACLRRLWKTAEPFELSGMLENSESHNVLVRPVAGLVRGRRPVQLCLTRDLERPGVIGFLAPRILIPEWLVGRLSAEELDQIVLHEMEHLRRRDDWSNLIQKLCLVVFPLNPALLWIERQLCQEREMACDEGVVRITKAPRAYAACLTSLAENGLRRHTERLSGALSLGVWHRKHEVVRRVHSILRRGGTLGPVAARGILAAFGSVLLWGSVELSRSPQLVAFVSTPRPEMTQAKLMDMHRVAAHASSSDQGDRVYREDLGTDQSIRPARMLAARITLGKSSRPSLMPLKAVMPERPVEARHKGIEGQRIVASAPRQELLTARLPEITSVQGERERADSQHQPAGQSLEGWVVFTAWEQVETASVQTTDASRVAPQGKTGADRSSDDELGPANDESGQRTITRMVFRVVPANFAPTPAAAFPVHGGWLVIQL